MKAGAFSTSKALQVRRDQPHPAQAIEQLEGKASPAGGGKPEERGGDAGRRPPRAMAEISQDDRAGRRGLEHGPDQGESGTGKELVARS
jgi:hypothetical protein